MFGYRGGIWGVRHECLARLDDLAAAVKDHVHRSAQELLVDSPIIREAVENGKVSLIEA